MEELTVEKPLENTFYPREVKNKRNQSITSKNDYKESDQLKVVTPVRLHSWFRNISCHASAMQAVVLQDITTVFCALPHSAEIPSNGYLPLNSLDLQCLLHFNVPVIFHPQMTNTCSQHYCRISRAFFSPWYLLCFH